MHLDPTWHTTQNLVTLKAYPASAVPGLLHITAPTGNGLNCSVEDKT